MSLVKRLSTTLFARLDEVVGEMENHDALIKATLDEQKKRVASAKVQLHKLRCCEADCSKELQELGVNAERWTQRAVSEAGSDEERALQCLQRRQQVQSRITRVETRRDDYHRAAEKMAVEVRDCEQRLQQLMQQHQLMRARQCSAEATNGLQDSQTASLDELEKSFERWEIKLAQREYRADTTLDIDPLEQTYVEQENRQALHDQLQELLAANKGSSRHD